MNVNKIVNFFFEMATLRRIARSHRQVIGRVNDSVADHSFRVTIIGMVLANLEGCDANRVMQMCLFHDIAEARTGDANHINKKYIKIDELSAINDQVVGLPIEKQIINLTKEYRERITKESKVAKDADLIDQMILQREYFYEDKTNGDIWQKYTQKNLITKSAKKIAIEIRKTNPFEWLYKVTGAISEVA